MLYVRTLSRQALHEKYKLKIDILEGSQSWKGDRGAGCVWKRSVSPCGAAEPSSKAAGSMLAAVPHGVGMHI